jgi:hypothetical protein
MAKSMRERIAERSGENNKLHQANKLKASKLMQLVENGHVNNEYDEGFIKSVFDRVTRGTALSENQQRHLDKCFEDY